LELESDKGKIIYGPRFASAKAWDARALHGYAQA
jgi:hypothetical protein